MESDETEALIVQITRECIEDLMEKVTEIPNLFYSEYDLHKILFCCIYRRLEEEVILWADTSYYIHDQYNAKTILVHSEFANWAVKNAPIDIVVLHPKEVKTINGPRWKVDGKNTKPYVAIEMKTDLNIGTVNEIEEHLKKDFEKLHKSEAQCKHFICIYRDTAIRFNGERHLEKVEEVNSTLRKLARNEEDIDSSKRIHVHVRYLNLQTGYIGTDVNDDWVGGM